MNCIDGFVENLFDPLLKLTGFDGSDPLKIMTKGIADVAVIAQWNLPNAFSIKYIIDKTEKNTNAVVFELIL